MRVIAGEFRSRRLKTLPGLALRPTPDRLREALFNILAPRIEGATFLDAYAGSGAVGIEAISRGAARAVFIEKHPAALRVIHENLAALGAEDRATVVQSAAIPALDRYTADIYFLDPPYDLAQEYTAALAKLRGRPGLVLAQHPKQLDLPGAVRTLRQGDNIVSFFENS